MYLQPFVKEAWAEYAIGSCIIILRLYASAKRLRGVRKWLADDYLMIVAWVLFTAEAWIWHEIGKGSAIVVNAETPSDLLEKSRLSKKFNLAVWPVYTTFIWTLKGCLLIFYHRLVGKTELRIWIVLAAWLLGVTWAGCILEIFLHCLPIHLKWISYPVPSPHCRSGIVNFLVVGLCNLITDLVLLGIPLPILYQLRIPFRRKLAIGLLLCSGIFIIVATILRNVSGYLLVKGNTGNWDWNGVLGWAVRENFIAIIVVNAPAIKPLFSSHKWIKLVTTRGRSVDKGSSSGSNNQKEATRGTATRGSSSFFRRYSSKTMRTFGLTTIDHGDDLDNSAVEKGLPGQPAAAHIRNTAAPLKDEEAPQAQHYTRPALTIHKISEVDTQVQVLSEGESPPKYPTSYLLVEENTKEK